MIKKILFILTVASITYAATTPNIGQILQQERQQSLTPKISEKVLKKEKSEKDKKVDKTSDVKVLVNDFIFEGKLTVFSQKELKSITQKHLNKKLDVNDLFKVLDKIKKTYKEKPTFNS